MKPRNLLYLPRVLTDANGADVRPGDLVVVQYQRGYAQGVYLGVRDERNYPAIVRLSGGETVRVWKNTKWVRVEYKQGDA